MTEQLHFERARAFDVAIELEAPLSGERRSLSSSVDNDVGRLAVTALPSVGSGVSSVLIDDLTAEVSKVRWKALSARGNFAVRVHGLNLSRASRAMVGDIRIDVNGPGETSLAEHDARLVLMERWQFAVRASCSRACGSRAETLLLTAGFAPGTTSHRSSSSPE